MVFGDSLIQHIVEGDTAISYWQPQYDQRDPWVQKMGYKGGGLIGSGYISVQSESHPVEFRKVRLFNLEPFRKNPKRLREVLRQLRERKSDG